MSKLNNVEKIEKTIFSMGNFTIKNTVLTGTKGKNDIKLNAIYDRSYNSSKYSDRPQLETINIRTSDFLVIAYNDFTNRINEEIFISYPHMYKFLAAFEEAINMVNTDEVYNGNNVSAKYSDTVIRIDNLSSGKGIAIIPHVIQQDQNFSRGIMMLLNSDDIAIELDINALMSLQYILSSFNLYESSAQLLLTGLLYDSDSVSESTSSSFGNTNTGSKFGGNSSATKSIFGSKSSAAPKRGIGSSAAKPTTGFKKPAVKNTTLDDLDKAVDGGLSNDDIPLDIEEPVVNSASSGNSSISLNDIMAASEEIEIPDLDDGSVDF